MTYLMSLSTVTIHIDLSFLILKLARHT